VAELQALAAEDRRVIQRLTAERDEPARRLVVISRAMKEVDEILAAAAASGIPWAQRLIDAFKQADPDQISGRERRP
jgi:hypothetical protein